MLAVCLVLRPFPPCVTVWTLMLPQTRGLICSPFSTAPLPLAAHPALASSHFFIPLTCAVFFLLQGLPHALAHSWGQVLHTHSLLAPCRPSGHSVFPDPLNKPPLLSWAPSPAVPHSLAYRTEVDLSSTTLSQLSEVAHLTSHILGPVSRSLLVSPGHTQEHFCYSL